MQVIEVKGMLGADRLVRVELNGFKIAVEMSLEDIKLVLKEPDSKFILKKNHPLLEKIGKFVVYLDVEEAKAVCQIIVDQSETVENK